MPEYHFPPIDLLLSSEESSYYQSLEESKKVAEKVNKMFADLKIASRVVEHKANPYSTILKIKPNGVTEEQIRGLRKDLEYATASFVEFQNNQAEFFIAVKRNFRPVVSLRQVMENTEYRESKSILPIAAGTNLFGTDFVIDLMKVYNLLVAGVTGAGKSVFLADVILSILYRATPDDVHMILMDNKGVDLTAFNGIPHLHGEKVIVKTEDEIDIFRWLKNETTVRMNEISRTKDKNIDDYNQKYGHTYKHIVVVVDEYSQLMQLMDPDLLQEMKSMIAEITRLTAFTGIHLVLATQNPSHEIINDDIQNNIKARVSFTVVDASDSRNIIRMTGAERLIGGGDMIYTTFTDNSVIHGRSSYVSDEEIDRVAAFLRNEKTKEN